MVFTDEKRQFAFDNTPVTEYAKGFIGLGNIFALSKP
jgi:hypothetical protein